MAKTTSLCAQLIIALLSVFFIASCSKDEGEIKMKTSRDITVYADDNSVAEAIRFDASNSWKASVNYQTAEGGSDWVTLSAYSGGVGECSISLTLKPNTTGKDRKATITIDTGDEVVTITVEQKSTSKDGDVPIDPSENIDPTTCRIVKIIKHNWYKSGYSTDDDGEETYEFSYDSSNRLVKIVQTEVDQVDYIYGYTGPKETETRVTTCDITYAAGTVSYEITTTIDGVEQKVKPSGSIVLENGRAMSGTYIDYDEKDGGSFKKYVSTYTLAYDKDGHLVKSSLIEDGEQADDEVITWTSGNPTQVVWGYTGSTQLIDKATYGNVKNCANLDLNWLVALDSEGWDFAAGDPYKVFAMLGYVGTRSANLASSLTDGAEAINGNSRIYNFTYETDGTTGWPVKMKRSTTDTGTEFECSIIYGI